MPEKGKVFLVGAGPGDPGLITVKGLRCLEEADVIVYDRLVNPRLLSTIKPGAELIYAGKGPHGRAMEQEEINQLLVAKAAEGKTVVRLKGGDPYVFGRGGEEAETLVQHGIPFEVVPGVTSAIAVPAYAGIPLTHRDYSSSFTVIPGRENPAKETSHIPWEALAKGGGTLVVLMGVESLPHTVETLLAHGLSSDTPIAIIHRGTEPAQRTVVGSLEDIVRKVKHYGIQPPAIAVIGKVVNLRERLRWYDNKPLYGKRVLVTRSRAQGSALSVLLTESGAQPVEVPTIEITPLKDFRTLDKALVSLRNYQWVVFTSANGVDASFHRLLELSRDARAFQDAKVCAIGSATATALRQRGIEADLVPESYTSQGVLDAFKNVPVAGVRFLLLRAEIGTETLKEGLSSRGASVNQVSVYRTAQPARIDPAIVEMLRKREVDVATFTSSSTAKNLVNLLGEEVDLLKVPAIASIGPVTTATLKGLGLRVDIEASEHTIPGLVGAITKFFSPEHRDKKKGG